MSKRKLSKQQKNRIEKIQQRRLARAQNILENHLVESDTELGHEQQGLLIAHHGKYIDVEDQDGKLFRCHMRQHLGTMIAGDKVIWRAGKKNTGVVIAVMPRESLLWRPNERNEIKAIAANIDQIVVVIAPQPKPTMSLIDSYLIAATVVNIKVILLLNKTDLLSEAEKPELQNLLNIYGNIGYAIYLANTQKSQGLKQIKGALEHHTSIIVGQSGVGKSSLIKGLIPNANIAIGELSQQKGHGAHTTTRSQLYHLPSGGDLIDSPGIREFGLWHMSAEAIAQGFVEFRDFLGHCKFRNCLHKNEPGCAILEAVAQDKIAKARWLSYLDIAKLNQDSG